MHLTDTDRLIVRETLDEIESAPPPSDPGSYGAPLALVGLAVLVGFAFLGRAMGLGGTLAVAILTIGGASLVIGLVLAMTSGGFERGVARAAVEAALRQLESDEEDREVTLRAATLLLAHAYVSHGPTMTTGFTPAEVSPRIAPALPLVVAVEEYLVEADRIDPAFTLSEDG